MPHHYKNSYKVTEKELVSLSVYNVGFQKCDALYQWGPGIRDHYLIHYIIPERHLPRRRSDLPSVRRRHLFGLPEHRGCLLCG